MPYTLLEKKVSKVSPQFMPELSDFIDFLLYRQENCEQAMGEPKRKSFLDVLASAKLEDGELNLSRSATAKTDNMVLVTRNVADMEHMGVALLNPWEYAIEES